LRPQNPGQSAKYDVKQRSVPLHVKQGKYFALMLVARAIRARRSGI
jgi:hypothetical protein